MDAASFAAFVGLGVVVGTIGTLIGAGGGFLIVPVLILGLHWPHDKAVGTSLFAVTCNAISGSVAYARKRRIDFRTGIAFAVATIPGAILGSTVLRFITGRVFDGMFGALLVVISVYLMLRSGAATAAPAVLERPAGPAGWGFVARRIVDKSGEVFAYGFSMPWGIALSFAVGFLSSILGIGGGIVHVPALVALFRFPAHIATATSHFILAISAATGTASHFTLGNVEPVVGLAIGGGAVLGAQIGGALSSRVKARVIVRALAAALTLVGIRLLWGAWVALG